jgi:hypothetical protein
LRDGVRETGNYLVHQNLLLGIEIGGPQMSQSVQRIFNVRDKLDPERHDVVFHKRYALLGRGGGLRVDSGSNSFSGPAVIGNFACSKAENAANGPSASRLVIQGAPTRVPVILGAEF